jgi:hypothetical protein
MSTALPIDVKDSLVKRFNKEHAKFIAAASSAAPAMVEAINTGRELGILLKELLGRENITENCLAGWLQDNPGALAETHSGWLMNYVRISNKLQGELKLFADAPREVVQMSLQCAGLLPPEAGRDGAQQRHEIAPVSVAWKCLTDLRLKFEGLAKSATNWDEETRSCVIRDIGKTRDYLQELEQQLSRPDLKQVAGFVEHH